MTEDYQEMWQCLYNLQAGNYHYKLKLAESRTAVNLQEERHSAALNLQEENFKSCDMKLTSDRCVCGQKLK